MKTKGMKEGGRARRGEGEGRRCGRQGETEEYMKNKGRNGGGKEGRMKEESKEGRVEQGGREGGGREGGGRERTAVCRVLCIT